MIETWGFCIVSALEPGGSINGSIAREQYQRAFDQHLDLWARCEEWRGGNLSGKVTTLIGAIEFDTGTVDGPEAQWHATETPMGPMKMAGKATIDGDDIWGDIDLGAGTPKLTFVGTRSG